jgi:hypothetical protein
MRQKKANSSRGMDQVLGRQRGAPGAVSGSLEVAGRGDWVVAGDGPAAGAVKIVRSAGSPESSRTFIETRFKMSRIVSK